MQFGRLIAYTTGNIFLEKSYTKCGAEAIPRPFYKKSKLNILWINSLKSYILFHVQVGVYQNIRGADHLH